MDSAKLESAESAPKVDFEPKPDDAGAADGTIDDINIPRCSKSLTSASSGTPFSLVNNITT